MKPRVFENKWLEWTVLGLFIIAYCVISAFHEPWYDEALSWQIGKCASLKDILITLPPYEGHPPLWHLLLSIPAKLGVPFEIGLKGIGLIVSAASAYVLVFHFKLPRVVRLLIPFTYFFFYQYGIVVRPYCLMLLVLLLLGINLPKRNEHPWKTFFLLLFLCLTSAYGMLMAAGISICIVIDIWKEKSLLEFFKGFIRDQRILSLVALFICALVLVIEFFPAADGYSVSIKGDNPLWLCIICALLSFPLNCFFLSSSWFKIEQLSIQTMSIDIVELLGCLVLSVIFWTLAACASSKKNLKYILVPYILYSIFAATVYFSTHHIGLVFLLFLFWAEYISRDEKRFEIGKSIIRRIAKTDRDRSILKYAFIVVCCFSIAIPLYWSVSASVHEISSDYSFGREAASFLRENGLEDCQILCNWNFEGEKYSVPEGHEDYINTYIVDTAVPINTYFSKNICMNLNYGKADLAYVLHRVPDYSESQEMVKKWAAMGAPDIIIGHPKLEYVYGDTVSYDDYSLVYMIENGFIWKGKSAHGLTIIYMRSDLLDDYGLKALNSTVFSNLEAGFQITEDMKEAYENGIPAEEILKPYLDAIFGSLDND